MSRNGRDMKRTGFLVPFLFLALVIVWQGPARGEPLAVNNLTGVEWLVRELSGHGLALSVEGQQPFIIFDEAKKQVTGYAGCNRFFGPYVLERDVLTFGPIGATKRACPDLEEGVETEFFKVLDATRRWRIVDGTLELLNGDLVLARLRPHQGS